jgi:hypothetical protein
LMHLVGKACQFCFTTCRSPSKSEELRHA